MLSGKDKYEPTVEEVSDEEEEELLRNDKLLDHGNSDNDQPENFRATASAQVRCVPFYAHSHLYMLHVTSQSSVWQIWAKMSTICRRTTELKL